MAGAQSVTTTASGAAGFTAWLALTLQGQADVLGASPAMLLAAMAGALFGLSQKKPRVLARLQSQLAVTPAEAYGRRSVLVLVGGFGLMFVLVTNAFVSSWTAVAAPHVPLLASLIGGVPEIPRAGLIGFGAQLLIPKALAAAGRWLDTRGKP
jgi:hypothetical protein